MLRRPVESALTALVRIEDIGRAVLDDRLLEGLDAEPHIHRDQQPPGQHLPAVPVDHGHQIDEAFGHRYVGDVRGPNLIGPRDGQGAQQARVDVVAVCLSAGIELSVQRSQAHARTSERKLRVQLIDASHQSQIGIACWTRRVLRRTAGDLHDLGLALHRQVMVVVEHRFALKPTLVSTPSKNHSPASATRFWRATPSDRSWARRCDDRLQRRRLLPCVAGSSSR